MGKMPVLSRNAGFAFLELILVVVVLGILGGWYFNRGGSTPHEEAASQYKYSMDKSKSTACLASRSAMQGMIATWQMSNPGKPLTAENLQAGGVNLNNCPEKGTITVGPGGTLVCSAHP